jgi:hypothetical protein
MLMFNRASHPWTYKLAQVAIEVGAFVVFNYKMVHNRPRPSQLCPWLMPPITVPPHASYPSGHSTQGHLLSGLLAEVMPKQVSCRLQPAPGSANKTRASLLDRMAERIARNREVLGLHYRSDTAAGKILADSLKPLLLECPMVIDMITQARTEWPVQSTPQSSERSSC